MTYHGHMRLGLSMKQVIHAQWLPPQVILFRLDGQKLETSPHLFTQKIGVTALIPSPARLEPRG